LLTIHLENKEILKTNDYWNNKKRNKDVDETQYLHVLYCVLIITINCGNRNIWW